MKILDNRYYFLNKVGRDLRSATKIYETNLFEGNYLIYNFNHIQVSFYLFKRKLLKMCSYHCRRVSYIRQSCVGALHAVAHNLFNLFFILTSVDCIIYIPSIFPQLYQESQRFLLFILPFFQQKKKFLPSTVYFLSSITRPKNSSHLYFLNSIKRPKISSL